MSLHYFNNERTAVFNRKTQYGEPHIVRSIILVRYILFIFLLLAGGADVFALGDPFYVSEKPEAGSLAIVSPDNKANIFVAENDFPGVVRAAGDLVLDVQRVTSSKPKLVHQSSDLAASAIIVGTLGRGGLVDDLVEAGVVDVSAMIGRWDAFHIQLVENPLPNVKRALLIIGADKRGTIYGIYDVSEQIGVSPWHYWADVPAARKEQIYIKAGTRKQDAPKVRYRGIFLNDEAPALTGWVQANHGNYNHQFYAKIFELMLRLKANYLWPAMWNNAFNDDDPKNQALADEYGIVMGTSHHEPMMRADKEWNRYGKGEWEYSTNRKNIYTFWQEGAQRAKPFESLFTMGMRGQEDAPMSEGENIELLEQIVRDQRQILAKTFDIPVSDVPQVWCLYKEVQAYYEKGMRVPDDITLLWSDDNWGNLRRLPTPEERKRSGGAGIYYHFDYVGGPRSYRWINTVPIAKIWEQMNLAYHHDANRIWITNVGDLKPMEFPTEFFLRMAWDPERWPKERLQEFGRLWAEREFGAPYAERIETLMTGYTRHNGRRKPELMTPDTYSVLHYQEAERVLAELQTLTDQAEQLYAEIPADKRDAFFQLVMHPVLATANITRLNIAVAKNRLYANQGRSTADQYRQQAKDFFQQDQSLKERYHRINNGKWQHFMDQPHIGYTNWQNPEGDQMPVVYEYIPGNYAEMGIALEGIAEAWPAAVSGEWPHKGKHELKFDFFGKQHRELTMFNRGRLPFDFTASADPWIKLTREKGNVETEVPINVSIDWEKLPDGVNEGAIVIRGTGWQSAKITVTASKPAAKLRRHAKGYVEADGYIAIEAANYAKSKKVDGFSWQEIAGHGRTNSAISPYPISDSSFSNPTKAPYVEYPVTFLSAGEVELQIVLAPSLPFVPGRGLRYAVAVGDEKPQIIDFLAEFNDTDARWERTVEDGVRIGRSQHRIKRAGPTTLKLFMVDSGVTVQRLLFDTGGLQPSYLGPPQSPYR
jgi:hypothetical protein